MEVKKKKKFNKFYIFAVIALYFICIIYFVSGKITVKKILKNVQTIVEKEYPDYQLSYDGFKVRYGINVKIEVSDVTLFSKKNEQEVLRIKQLTSRLSFWDVIRGKGNLKISSFNPELYFSENLKDGVNLINKIYKIGKDKKINELRNKLAVLISPYNLNFSFKNVLVYKQKKKYIIDRILIKKINFYNDVALEVSLENMEHFFGVELNAKKFKFIGNFNLNRDKDLIQSAIITANNVTKEKKQLINELVIKIKNKNFHLQVMNNSSVDGEFEFDNESLAININKSSLELKEFLAFLDGFPTERLILDNSKIILNGSFELYNLFNKKNSDINFHISKDIHIKDDENVYFPILVEGKISGEDFKIFQKKNNNNVNFLIEKIDNELKTEITLKNFNINFNTLSKIGCPSINSLHEVKINLDNINFEQKNISLNAEKNDKKIEVKNIQISKSKFKDFLIDCSNNLYLINLDGKIVNSYFSPLKKIINLNERKIDYSIIKNNKNWFLKIENKKRKTISFIKDKFNKMAIFYNLKTREISKKSFLENKSKKIFIRSNDLKEAVHLFINEDSENEIMVNFEKRPIIRI